MGMERKGNAGPAGGIPRGPEGDSLKPCSRGPPSCWFRRTVAKCRGALVGHGPGPAAWPASGRRARRRGGARGAAGRPCTGRWTSSAAEAAVTQLSPGGELQGRLLLKDLGGVHWPAILPDTKKMQPARHPPPLLDGGGPGVPNWKNITPALCVEVIIFWLILT